MRKYNDQHEKSQRQKKTDSGSPRRAKVHPLFDMGDYPPSSRQRQPVLEAVAQRLDTDSAAETRSSAPEPHDLQPEPRTLTRRLLGEEFGPAMFWTSLVISVAGSLACSYYLYEALLAGRM